MANTRGRQPIGFNQPSGGGSNYPFVSPSSDIEYLIGDLFVSFDDLADQIVYPLRVAWLYGFGTDPSINPSGFPTPTHSQDIIIWDANDVTVFDSTTASSFKTDTWDSRLEILEWENDDNVLRCTRHTEWTQADIDDGLDKTYALYITPTNGVLQADTWYKMPKRVKSLQVGLSNIEKTRVRLVEGYNIGFTIIEDTDTPVPVLPNINVGESTDVVAGTRRTNRISIAADPGLGLGVFPGCTDVQTLLRTINRINGNDYQNFVFDSEGCIRNQRPVGLTSLVPREFAYASFALTDTEAKAAIEVLNDCTNCCDCEYFAQTYQGIKRQWFLHQDIATLAEQTRDDYAANRDRWLVQKAIRETNNLRIRVEASGNSKVRWGVSHCNSSKCCLLEGSFRLTWLYYLNGVLTTPTKMVYDCLKSKIDGSAQCNNKAEEFTMASDPSGLVADAFWDYADPQTVTSIQGTHCFPDTEDVEPEALKVKLHAMVLWDNQSTDPATNEACPFTTLEEADFDADVLATWTALGLSVPTAAYSQQLSELLVSTSDNPYCERCPCTEGGSIG